MTCSVSFSHAHSSWFSICSADMCLCFVLGEDVQGGSEVILLTHTHHRPFLLCDTVGWAGETLLLPGGHLVGARGTRWKKEHTEIQHIRYVQEIWFNNSSFFYLNKGNPIESHILRRFLHGGWTHKSHIVTKTKPWDIATERLIKHLQLF